MGTGAAGLCRVVIILELADVLWGRWFWTLSRSPPKRIISEIVEKDVGPVENMSNVYDYLSWFSRLCVHSPPCFSCFVLFLASITALLLWIIVDLLTLLDMQFYMLYWMPTLAADAMISLFGFVYQEAGFRVNTEPQSVYGWAYCRWGRPSVSMPAQKGTSSTEL